MARRKGKEEGGSEDGETGKRKDEGVRNGGGGREGRMEGGGDAENSAVT